MKNPIKQIGKDSVIYGIGNFIRRGIGFFLLPIYTRYLSPGEYGQLELLTITVALLTIIIVQGITTAFFRFYPFLDTDRQKKELISTSFFYLVFSAFILCGTVFIFAQQLSEIIYKNDDLFTLYIRIIAVTAFFQILSIIFFQLYRARLQSFKFVTISICSFFIQVSFNIYFVVALKLGVQGVLIGDLINAIILFFVNIWISRSELNLYFSFDMLKELLQFGIPLILVGISNWILQITDRVMLQKLATTHDLGLYSLGSRFANTLTILVVVPFSRAWGAYCFQIAKRDGAKYIFRQITTYWYFVLGFLGTLLVILSPIALKIIAPKSFWDAEIVIFPLVLTSVVIGMSTIFDLGINIAKKTKYMAHIVSVGAVINIGLNVILIPSYGMVGAAYASLVSYLLIMIMTYLISQRLYYIPFAKIEFYKITGLLILITSLSTIFSVPNFIANLFYRFFFIFLFIGGAFLLKIFSKEEISFLKSVFNDMKKTEGLKNKIQYCYSLIKS